MTATEVLDQLVPVVLTPPPCSDYPEAGDDLDAEARYCLATAEICWEQSW